MPEFYLVVNIPTHPGSASTVQLLTTSVAASAAARQPTKPEFFPMPARGLDPHFGLSRSSYYDFERAGLLKLVRVRKPGNQRGKVLIPYNAVLEMLQRMNPETQTGSPPVE